MHPQLPNNRSIAEKRLQNLGKRLIRDKDVLKKYTGGINDLIEKNDTELIPEEQEDGPVDMRTQIYGVQLIYRENNALGSLQLLHTLH